ncbi:MAG: SPOR domain-containing protein, partial [Magnetococcales bacterium]|nr:SPOR domain-containing protein [Magnetococcales bacterium]
IYLGSFNQKKRADAMYKKLSASGLPMTRQEIAVVQGRLPTLCSGPFPTRREAEEAAQLIRDETGMSKLRIREAPAAKINGHEGCKPGS